MTGKRKRYAAEFKAKIALAALRGELTTAQLATKHGVHQTMISEWKRQAVEGLASVFSGKADAREGLREGELEKLDAKIGQLLVERDFRQTVPPKGTISPGGSGIAFAQQPAPWQPRCRGLLTCSGVMASYDCLTTAI